MADVLPSCPRCGYDQTGLVATWAEHCPTEGVCAECGLAFAWRDVLNPRWTIPAWSFEHATDHRLRALLRTAWESFRPRRFWAQLPIAAPVRLGRLMAFAAVWVVGAHLMLAIISGLLEWDGRSAAPLRAWLLSWTRPIAGRSVGNFSNYVSPIEAFWNPYLVDDGYGYHVRYQVDSLAWCVPLVWLGMPLAMLTLGDTLAMARVRRVHLVRVACHQAFVASAVFTLAHIVAMLGHAGAYWSPRRLGEVRTEDVVALVFLTVWSPWWWWTACTRYLKLPAPGMVVGASWLIAVVFAVAVSYWVLGQAWLLTWGI